MAEPTGCLCCKMWGGLQPGRGGSKEPFVSPGLCLPHLLQTDASPLRQGSCVPKPAAGQRTAWAGSPQHPFLGVVSRSVANGRGLVVKSWPQAPALHFTFTPLLLFSRKQGEFTREKGVRAFCQTSVSVFGESWLKGLGGSGQREFPEVQRNISLATEVKRKG